jgi:predicted DNA-binding WGR domain protein
MNAIQNESTWEESRRWVLYRFDHADGTAKEYAVSYDGSVIHARWGKAGHLVGKKTYSAEEGRQKVTEKERKGYEFVGEVTLLNGTRPVRYRIGEPLRLDGTTTPPRLPPAVPKADPIDIKALLGGDDDGFYF